MEEKTIVEQLSEELTYSPKHACRLVEESEVATADSFCEGYKEFLNICKTERECVRYIVDAAKEKGLVRLEGKEYVMKDGDVTLFRFNV